MPKNTIPAPKIAHSSPGRETEKSRAFDSIMTHARDFPDFPFVGGHFRPFHGRQPAGPANTGRAGQGWLQKRLSEPRALRDVIVLKFSQHGGAP